MSTLHQSLMGYRLELSQWRERKRAHELQAAEAGQKAALVEARIAGILEAAGLLGAEVEGVESPSAKTKKRQRSLSGPWKDIMTRANQHGPSFGYDDLEDFAAVIGHSINRDTLRSQMSGYKTAGLVESVGDGRFRVTELGKTAAGIVEKEAEAPQEGPTAPLRSIYIDEHGRLVRRPAPGTKAF